MNALTCTVKCTQVFQIPSSIGALNCFPIKSEYTHENIHIHSWMHSLTYTYGPLTMFRCASRCSIVNGYTHLHSWMHSWIPNTNTYWHLTLFHNGKPNLDCQNTHEYTHLHSWMHSRKPNTYTYCRFKLCSNGNPDVYCNRTQEYTHLDSWMHSWIPTLIGV